MLVIEGAAHGVIMGMQAGGQQVTWRHSHWFRISAGKIVEHDAIRDDRGLLRQLGMNVRGPHPGGLGGGFTAGSGETAPRSSLLSDCSPTSGTMETQKDHQ